MIIRPVFLSLLFLPMVLAAHHARVYFTDEVIEIEGELIGIGWKNPHPAMTLSVTDPSGQETVWNLEVSGSVYPLRRQGVTQDLFRIGQSVQVAGQVSARNDRELHATNILLDGEREVLLGIGANEALYWDKENAIGAERWIAYAAVCMKCECLLLAGGRHSNLV